MRLFPYQTEGVQWLQTHFRAILGDEPGLGKTVQAIELIKACPGIQKVLVVCPANAKSVWVSHTKESMSVTEMSCRAENPIFDSRITICNYDILPHRINQLNRVHWDLIIFDEAHYLKNAEAQRSSAAFGHLISANRVLFITGTPMVNRPVELWPMLYAIDRALAGSYMDFTKKYCGGHYDDNMWRVDGATNLPELNELLSKVMLRRYKKDVLTQLPPKIRTVIELDSIGWAGLKDEYGNDWEAKIRAMKRDKKTPSQDVLARMRSRDGVAKVPSVVRYIQERLDKEPESKLIVFAHHVEVIEILKAHFYPHCVGLTGSCAPPQRAEVVRRFQTDEKCRIFFGNIQAAGTAITLTAANRVIFAEQSWVPGEMDQAECRPHRIGQTETVWVDWLVAKDSVDSIICPVLLRKMEIIDKAVNGKIPTQCRRDVALEAFEIFA